MPQRRRGSSEVSNRPSAAHQCLAKIRSRPVSRVGPAPFPMAHELVASCQRRTGQSEGLQAAGQLRSTPGVGKGKLLTDPATQGRPAVKLLAGKHRRDPRNDSSSRNVRLICDCDMRTSCHAETPLFSQSSHDMGGPAINAARVQRKGTITTGSDADLAI